MRGRDKKIKGEIYFLKVPVWLSEGAWDRAWRGNFLCFVGLLVAQVPGGLLNPGGASDQVLLIGLELRELMLGAQFCVCIFDSLSCAH